MVMSREEVEERMRRAAEQLRILRRATRKLEAFGAALLAARDAAGSDGRSESR
jgi:hypothetical protein